CSNKHKRATTSHISWFQVTIFPLATHPFSRLAMHIVNCSHSYRQDDAAINRDFQVLIEQAERIIINFHQPPETANKWHLNQNLSSCDGMIAVLSWRQAGPSAYILHEIGLALRARKPLLVLVDDRLPDNILPARILQRRFSHRLYFRQFR